MSAAPPEPPGQDAGEAAPLAPGTLLALWAVVLVEMLLPVPGVLTLGALYVLLVRPPWFLRLVQGLYRDGGDTG